MSSAQAGAPMYHVPVHSVMCLHCLHCSQEPDCLPPPPSDHWSLLCSWGLGTDPSSGERASVWRLHNYDSGTFLMSPNLIMDTGPYRHQSQCPGCPGWQWLQQLQPPWRRPCPRPPAALCSSDVTQPSSHWSSRALTWSAALSLVESNWTVTKILT